MKVYISTGSAGKRVTVTSSSGSKDRSQGGGSTGGGYSLWEIMMKLKGGTGGSTSTTTTSTTTRRCSCRSVVIAVFFVLGIMMPFLFIRTALLAIESVSSCSSFDCIGWKLGPRFLGGSDQSMQTQLGNELTRALIQAKDEEEDEQASLQNDQEETGTDSYLLGHGGGSLLFNDLVADIALSALSESSGQDVNTIKAFASKTKATISKMESRIRSARRQESMYRQLASYGVPKPMHCLSLRLAEEYSSNAMARSPLPHPEFVYRLINTSYHHLALLTDNILAASVVVSSTVANSAHPENLVFHIVTDKKTYAPMHAWFALNPVAPAVVEVKGLHQFDWPLLVNVRVKEMLEIHRSIYAHFKQVKRQIEGNYDISPSCYSLMNHLRIYLPELFPELNRLVLLDDDVVVQKDLSSLWALDLNGKVNGAVVTSLNGNGEAEREHHCLGKLYGDYFNFSNPKVSLELKHDQCAWLGGMNVLDLKAWRMTNITETYHSWLKHNLDSGFTLWHPGVFPPAIIAFEGQIHPLDPSWHAAGLGDQGAKLSFDILEAAAVVHFSGPAKPWLDIGVPELRSLWSVYVNYSNELIKDCHIME